MAANNYSACSMNHTPETTNISPPVADYAEIECAALPVAECRLPTNRAETMAVPCHNHASAIRRIPRYSGGTGGRV